MMIYLQKRVIDQNGRSPSSTENSKIRCGMTDTYYLAPIRSSPLRSYKRSSHSKSIGISGAYTASVLANLQAAASRGSTIEREKLEKFNTWLNIIFPNTKVKAQTIDELVKIKLENNKLQSEDTITDVGFGFSQVLPILIQGALLNPNELLIIEQPELHLHPNAQFLFAQVLCSMANGGVQLLIETHSEHLLRGIQLEISKHRIHSSKGIRESANKYPTNKK
ncbi:AAA family ATPase [Aeromonas caviae]|uniref:AAA family ATPase n=1 Tax=Aeromonas caviae TaxID=648 RepID=A0A3S5WYI1_AERCA|nr:AAA family ATPase [Aeromonas caviae]AXB06076.1 AAA family ATPase [Aeromonas caviae]AXB09175.1 AAA family ATPase [Aeromonas caviae]